MTTMYLQPRNRRITRSSRRKAEKPIHSLVGVPPEYAGYMAGLHSSKEGDDGIGINYDEADGPDGDELLEHVTVCISVYNMHATVQVVVNKGMFDIGTSLGWNTIEMNEPTDVRYVHLAFHDDQCDSYDIFYDKATVSGSRRRYFVISKFRTMRLSLVLATMLTASPGAYLTFDTDCLEFAKVYCQVLHSLAGSPMDAEAVTEMNNLTITEFKSERSVRGGGTSQSLGPSAALSLSLETADLLKGALLVVPVYVIVRLLYVTEQWLLKRVGALF